MKEIKYLVLDVDGTLTDGKIHMGQNGELYKTFDIKDGAGIANILPINNIKPIIMTGRTSKIVLQRCKELGVTEVYQGIKDKKRMLTDIAKQKNASLSDFAYMGDDINDLQCFLLLKEVGGVTGAPNNATDTIKKNADYISEHQGGDGAVRDFIDWLVAH